MKRELERSTGNVSDSKATPTKVKTMKFDTAIMFIIFSFIAGVVLGAIL